MGALLRAQVRLALPSEQAVLLALRELPSGAWREAAGEVQAHAPNFDPNFDVVLTVAGEAEAFARAVAELAHAEVAVAQPEAPAVPHLRAQHWAVAQRPLVGKRRALLVTSWLTDGATELDLASLVRAAFVPVTACLSAVEFTSRGGRSRLDMHAVKVLSLVRLAHTPEGVRAERRGVGGDLLLPLT